MWQDGQKFCGLWAEPRFGGNALLSLLLRVAGQVILSGAARGFPACHLIAGAATRTYRAGDASISGEKVVIGGIRTEANSVEPASQRLTLIQFFFDSRRATASFSEIVQLCLTDIAATLNGNTCNQRTVRLEGSLNANTVRNLSKDECRI